MKAFLAAVATMVVVTAAAPFVLNQMGLSSTQVSPTVRLD